MNAPPAAPSLPSDRHYEALRVTRRSWIAESVTTALQWPTIPEADGVCVVPRPCRPIAKRNGGPRTAVPWLIFGNQQLAATTEPSMQSAEASNWPVTAVLRASAPRMIPPATNAKSNAYSTEEIPLSSVKNCCRNSPTLYYFSLTDTHGHASRRRPLRPSA